MLQFRRLPLFVLPLLWSSSPDASASAQTFPTPPPPDPASQIEALKAQHAILQSPNQFGTRCCQILQIPAASFTQMDPNGGHEIFGPFPGWAGLTTDSLEPASVWASVTLPGGAALDFLDLYYWKAFASGDVCADLIGYFGPNVNGDPPGTWNIATTCSGSNAGTGYAPIPANATINNNVYWDSNGANYVVVVRTVAPSSPYSLGFKAVDIWWHRQVSPAPAIATFNDVPTNHPFFQFVEALVASGITVGCQAAPPLYCPDAPLTRKQMAAFLAKGLGLYWPY